MKCCVDTAGRCGCFLSPSENAEAERIFTSGSPIRTFLWGLRNEAAQRASGQRLLGYLFRDVPLQPPSWLGPKSNSDTASSVNI